MATRDRTWSCYVFRLRFVFSAAAAAAAAALARLVRLRKRRMKNRSEDIALARSSKCQHLPAYEAIGRAKSKNEFVKIETKRMAEIYCFQFIRRSATATH